MRPNNASRPSTTWRNCWAERFLELIASAISSNQAHLADAKTKGSPQDAEHWGWQGGHERGRHIGWLDGDDVLLETTSAFGVAQKLAKEEGDPIAVKGKTLWKRLAQRGLLASKEPPRNTARWEIAGKRKRVLHLKAGTLPL